MGGPRLQTHGFSSMQYLSNVEWGTVALLCNKFLNYIQNSGQYGGVVGVSLPGFYWIRTIGERVPLVVE